MPQRQPEVATVKTRSLAASLKGELVFLFSVQKLLFVQDFRSISLQETHLSVLVWCYLKVDSYFLLSSLLGLMFWRQLRKEAQSFDANVTL